MRNVFFRGKVLKISAGSEKMFTFAVENKRYAKA